jgi:hypothetical protein
MTKANQPLFPVPVAEAVADPDSKRKYLKTNGTRFSIATDDPAKIETSVNAAQTARANLRVRPHPCVVRPHSCVFARFSAACKTMPYVTN